MKSNRKPSGPSDAAVRKLLDKYECPTPFHTIRAVFLGNIASPSLDAGQPMQLIAQMWGGEMPELAGVEEMQALVDALVGGLWNRLTDHQSSKHPFHLTRIALPDTNDTLMAYANTRLEEINGFIEGLFGDDEEIRLPARAHEAVTILQDLCGFYYGIANVEEPSDDPVEIKQSAQMFGKLVPIAEREINAAVRACTRARREALQSSLPQS